MNTFAAYNGILVLQDNKSDITCEDYLAEHVRIINLSATGLIFHNHPKSSRNISHTSCGGSRGEAEFPRHPAPLCLHLLLRPLVAGVVLTGGKGGSHVTW